MVWDSDVLSVFHDVEEGYEKSCNKCVRIYIDRLSANALGGNRALRLGQG